MRKTYTEIKGRDRLEQQIAAEERSYWEGVQLANEAVLKMLIEQFVQSAGCNGENEKKEILDLLEKSAKNNLSQSVLQLELDGGLEHNVGKATLRSIFLPVERGPSRR